MRDLLIGLISRSAGLDFAGRHRNMYVYFVPHEWKVSTLESGNDSHRFFRFVFHIHSNQLTLYLETSPGDEKTRQRLYEMGRKDESLFNRLEHPDTSAYPKLYSRVFLTPEAFEAAGDGEWEDEIRRQWNGFLEEDMPRIEAAVRRETWIWESTENDPV